MKVFGVNFDIGHYLEVEADSPEEAESIAKDNMRKALEGEAHGFDAEELKKPQKDSPTTITLSWYIRKAI